MSRCPCCMYRAQCAGRVLAHATTNTNTTRKQRHRAASPVAVRSPIQARITPRGARRDAYSPPMPPVFLHHQPPPSPCWQRRRLQLFCQRLRKGRQRSVERRRRSASLTSVRRALSCPALAAAAARCAVGGLLCTDRRCTAPPCASRGGRAAREGAVSRAICSACHGARARGWAHWSIGTWSAAARASGSTRVWAVRSGRARAPRAPGRSPYNQARPQTAQQPHRATFVTRCACGAGPALRRKEVVDGSHDRPSQRGATITWPSGAAAPPGSSAGTALSRCHDLYDNPRGRPQAARQS